ncbi:MAG: hypothetical protein M3Y12_02155 [Bacteroidota bacterium]|nr:hypothetical protein [Bacteroidota bacterium]
MQPSTATIRPIAEASKDTAGTAAWRGFVGSVELGLFKDPKGQYVSKSTFVPSDGLNARPIRPKGDDTKRLLSSLPAALGGTANLFPQPTDPDDGGGGGGGVYVPNYTHFSSTEMVQPWDSAPYATSPTGSTSKATHRTTAFYTTENPNGYLYDLKIVKGPNPNRTGFNDSPYYHNIEIDLNEGAGGEYIYVSFTRDPSQVQYQTSNWGCGYNGSGTDETPRDINGNRVDSPIKWIDTEVRCCSAAANCNGIYTPMYATLGYTVDSNHFKFPDLNDGAGGSYIYAWQTRVATPYHNQLIELGVLTGNNVNIQPPAGWQRVGSDLNNGAGGSYIFFCVNTR